MNQIRVPVRHGTGPVLLVRGTRRDLYHLVDQHYRDADMPVRSEESEPHIQA